MKLKRYIALVLCALYIAATASVSLASVTCKCLGMKRAAIEHCCTDCSRLHDHTAACNGGLLGTDCDCERHSTRIDLYTSSHSDDSEKYIRCIVSDLPPSLTVEVPCPVALLAAGTDDALRSVPLPHEAVLRNIGLRAPPVLV